MSFRDLDPTYVRFLLSGLRDAMRQGRKIEWIPVLELCEWIVKQPRDSTTRIHSEHLDLDPGWGWTRKEIASVLSSGMEKSERGLNFDLRDRVWTIIELLANDPDPTPEDESRYLKEGSELGHLSINTTRGEAIHTVVRYALWVRRSLEIPDSDSSLDRCREVQRVLEEHLDWSKDPSLTIRSVYGQWFPWLVLFDSDWAAGLADEIFPEDGDKADRWWAAWNMYATFCHPYTTVFEVLRKKYDFAVSNLGKWKGKADSLEHPEKRFAEHLIMLFGRGLVSLDEGSLLWELFKRGSVELRVYALEFVGRSAETAGEKGDVVDRFKRLWEWRKERLKSSKEDDQMSEQACFGGWFATGVFESKWSIEELLKLLRAKVPVDRTFAVVKKLSDIVEDFPLATLECLDLLLDREGMDWGVSASRDETRNILTVTLKSGDSRVKDRARGLWNRLGRLPGYEDFRELGDV